MKALEFDFRKGGRQFSVDGGRGVADPFDLFLMKQFIDNVVSHLSGAIGSVEDFPDGQFFVEVEEVEYGVAGSHDLIFDCQLSNVRESDMGNWKLYWSR